jgi:hypothetical protein
VAWLSSPDQRFLHWPLLTTPGGEGAIRYGRSSSIPGDRSFVTYPCRIATVFKVVKPYSASKPFSRP